MPIPMLNAIVTVPNNKITLQDSIEEAKISGKFNELVQGFLRRQIIAQQAQQLGIKATTQELQVAADLLRKNQKLDTAAATLQWLKANFLSVDDFEKIVLHKLITEKLAQHLFGDRVEHYFYQNTLEYSGAILYEVVVEDRELAMELFYALQEGDLNFADVARQYILDSELKRRGGYLGTVNRKQLRPEISAAIFAAKPPQLIKPVITAIGVHLIYVEEINQPKLDEILHQKILMDIFDAWLNEQVASVSNNISIEL
jgi:parvulin-like peptidyl-prolyl isomerase